MIARLKKTCLILLGVVVVFAAFHQKVLGAGLIVNEASNGTSGAKEFYELMVVGDASSPTGAVNAHNWIIDDNNGDWEGVISGVGIAPGYARLDALSDPANCSSLASLSPGTIIVVYNDGDPNLNLPPDDSTDANGDDVYILRATGSCVRTCPGPPSSSDSSYSACSTAATSSYSPLALRNSGDVAQSRDASGTLFHGFTYGDITAPYPVGSFSVTSSSGSRSTLLFSCGDWYSGANFSVSPATTDTPGAENNALNTIFRQKVQTGTFDYLNPSSSLNCTASGPPDLVVTKSVSVENDPVNGSSNPYSIPGAHIIYQIDARNEGTGTVDMDTIVMIDALPPELEIYVGDFAGVGSGPVIFQDGSPSSGLSYSFVSLSNTGDNLSFSNNGGISYGYTPIPDADGFDVNVTHVRVNPVGIFAASDGFNHPAFTISFRARVK